MKPIHSFSIVAGALLSVTGCRVFEPTIPDREGQLRVRAQEVPLALGDEHPDQLEAAGLYTPAPTHKECVPPAPIPARLESDQLVSLSLNGAVLRDTLDDLARRANASFVYEADVSQRVDLQLPQMPIPEACAWVLERHGLRLVRQSENLFRVLPVEGANIVRASFRLHSTKVEAVSANLQTIAGGNARLIMDDNAGVINVQGEHAIVREIAEYLDQVDQRPPQVLVEARILEVTLGENFQLGVTGAVDGSINGGALGVLQNLSVQDDAFSLNLATSDGSVEATIQAISRFVGTDLVSSPRVLALSGTEAVIEVMREVPYVQVTSTTSGTTGGIGTQTLEEVQFKEAGVRLKVTPTLESGGYIRMRVDQELSEVVDRFNDIPVIDKRTIGVHFLVRDRDTVVLGGLMQDRRSEADKGVPGLASLPLVGRLFRSDEDERSKRELIVFLTPRVVDHQESKRIVEAMRKSYADSINSSGVRATSEAQVKPW